MNKTFIDDHLVSTFAPTKRGLKAGDAYTVGFGFAPFQSLPR